MEFDTRMNELFNEIDMNGDENLEWEEFTRLTVEKARLLNKSSSLVGIPNYYDSSKFLDSSAHYRHRHDVSHLCHIPKLMAFALTEDHKNVIWILSVKTGKLISTIAIDAVPLALEYISEKDLLVAACADMTLVTITVDDNIPSSKKFHINSVWPTSGAQMSLAWISTNQTLYSGSTNGLIHAWDIRRKNCTANLKGHKDIVMCLLGLSKLDNLVSASLDRTIGVWDTYTNTMILRLEGHKKGIFSLSYNPEYRLLVSCGFDHDAFVWSPFVNSLVFRLKGHHASLVGCQCVESSPEIITADSSGIFKVWDIRNFACVQTFASMESGGSGGGSKESHSSELTCFFHYKNLAVTNRNQVAARIFAASKWLYSFDQMRIVNELSTDTHEVIWTAFVEATYHVITVSVRNLIVWDAVLGSKSTIHENVCGEDITSCCLDTQKQIVFLGDTMGRIRAFNPSNGTTTKSAADDVKESVEALDYADDSKLVIAGFSNGHIRIYDDAHIDDIPLLRSFDTFNTTFDLTFMLFSVYDHTVLSAGTRDNKIKLWDYDSGKSYVEFDVCPSSETTVCITYLSPYPLIATGDSLGNVVVWGSLGCAWQGQRISGFLNQAPSTAEFEEISTRTAAMYLSPNNGQQQEPPRLILPVDLPGEEEGSHKSPIVTSNIKSVSTPLNDMAIGSLDAVHLNTTGLSHGETIAPHVLKESLRESTEQVRKWGPLAPAKTMAWDGLKSQLYTGDELGTIRKWDLSDLITDLGGQSLLQPRKNNLSQKFVFRKIKHKHRNSRSALVPVGSQDTTYLVGYQSRGSYLGVEFCWAMSGHRDSIIHCRWTPFGLLSSCTGRLLKMWSSEGRPIGLFMSGVPVGVRSNEWNLELDVKTVRKNEREELEMIMEKVVAHSKRPEPPKTSYHLTPNSNPNTTTAKVSNSTLQKRIERSSRILGLVFESQKVEASHNSDSKGVYESLPSKSPLNGTIDEIQQSTLRSRASSTSTISVSKTSRAAIEEANLAELEPSEEEKETILSENQRKRRDRNMENIVRKYEGGGSVLPSLRVQTTGLTVDVAAIEGLSALMNDENASLGKMRKSHLKSSTKITKLGGKNSTKHSSNFASMSNLSRQTQSTIGDERAAAIRKKCVKFDSFSKLEASLSKLMDPIDRLEKEEYRKKKQSLSPLSKLQSLSISSPTTNVNSTSTDNSLLLAPLPEVENRVTDDVGAAETLSIDGGYEESVPSRLRDRSI